jgi:hypothetical protein
MKLKKDFEGDFDAALLELFTYTLFSHQGFIGTVDPPISERGNLLTPDFHFSNGGVDLFVEVTVVRDMSVEEMKRENVMNAVFDTLSTIHSPNFLLDLSRFELKISSRSPTLRGLKHFVEREVMKYDPDKIVEEWETRIILVHTLSMRRKSLRQLLD